MIRHIPVDEWLARNKREPARDDVEVWQAFSAAYTISFTPVLRYLFARIGNIDLAEDLAGETFERGLRNWHTFQARSPAPTWFLGIARNVLHDHWRHNAKESAALAALARALPSASPPVDEEVSRWAEHHLLSRAIAQLPKQDRELLALRYAAQLPWREIGLVLKVLEGAARVRMHRTLNRMRLLLHAVGDEHDPV